MTPTCSTCLHMRMVNDTEKCASPQIIAAHGGMSRTIFEADSFENEHNRHKPETRKCGVNRVNYVRRTA